MKHTARPIKFRSSLTANQQYTYATTIGSKVYMRARNADGSPVYAELKPAPVFFTPAQTAADADAHGYDGIPLMSHMCDNLPDGREFVEECANSRIPVYGDIQAEYVAIHDTYGAKDVVPDMDRLYIWNFDIETDRDDERGYAPVDDPFNPVISITVKWRHMGDAGVVVYGTQPYTPKGQELYVQCADEREMLRSFLTDLRSNGDYPDVLTGYNVQFYDVPYLLNRLKLLFGEEVWIQFSPMQRVASRRVTLNGREMTVMDIKGLAILDYYELYRKFTYQQQESYRLDHIAHVELKKRKLSYSEFRSLRDLYRQDYQKFIEYNIQDVELVDELDAKLKLIELVCALAYSAKANFVDTFKQVRLWDIMIYHKLRADGLQIPPRKSEEKNSQYAGAYVKDPQVGQHDWVCSFDVASMYPHIIRQWNLSPETITSRETVGQWTVEDFLDEKVDVQLHVGLDIAGNDHTLAGNGLQTARSPEGFLPNMLKTLYDERVRYKKMAGAAKKELEHVKELMRTQGDSPELQAQTRTLVKQISACNNQQMVRKVNLNSAYGALGSPYFRYYDTHMAEAVTITGQLIIRWIARDVNAYLNGLLKTNDDYIIASDTDSVYVRFGPLVERWMSGRSKERVVGMLDRFCAEKIEPVLDASFDRLATYLNVSVPCLTMKREVIADRGVWTAKKRYILNVFDNEGVRYDTPQLKVMGIEAIKSSTPAICRDMIMDSLRLFMNATQEELWAYLTTCRERFAGASFEDVAFPRSVNGLAKYSGKDKGIPIHVRGAQAFNEALVRTHLTAEHEPVHEGEKIKFAYLREPNKFHTHVMSAPQGCPPEWEIEKVLDYDTQFQRAFLDPLQTIVTAAGWSVVNEPSLFD
jgi:DNA polymerase elongation subunit (family B)